MLSMVEGKLENCVDLIIRRPSCGKKIIYIQYVDVYCKDAIDDEFTINSFGKR